MTADTPSRQPFLNVDLDPLTMEQTLDRIEILVASGGPHQHVVVNAAKAVLAARDEQLAAIIRDCALVNADGQSVVWASRLLGHRVPERVAGIDLMERLLERAADRGLSVYFLGAEHAVVERFVEIISARHPGLAIAGWRDGYWSDDEEDEVVAAVARAGPSILLVAFSSPRKEYFLARQLSNLGVPFVMGVGGAFDVVVGKVARAPLWAQRAGLEWSYRLVQEPRRMIKRYLVGNTRFVLLVTRAWWRSR